MTITVATTTITVAQRPPAVDVDTLDDDRAYATIATGVRAVISRARGSERFGDGEQVIYDWTLSCDVPAGVTLRHADQVVDEQTGQAYQVAWAQPRTGLGLDHIKAGLRVVEGQV